MKNRPSEISQSYQAMQRKDWDVYTLPIITNARQGRALSAANRPRRARLTRPAVIIGLAVIAFWGVAVLVISAL